MQQCPRFRGNRLAEKRLAKALTTLHSLVVSVRIKVRSVKKINK